MSIPAIPSGRDRGTSFSLGGAGLFAVGTYLAARLGIPQLPAGSLVVAVLALAAVVAYALFLRATVRRVRALDELERRIHLDALAVAFPLAMLGMMILGLIDLAVTLPSQLNYRVLWLSLPLLYEIGLWQVRRRYR